MELCDTENDDKQSGWEGVSWNQNWHGQNNWSSGAGGWNQMNWNQQGGGWQGYNQQYSSYEPIEQEMQYSEDYQSHQGNGYSHIEGNSSFSNQDNRLGNSAGFSKNHRRPEHQLPSLMEVNTNTTFHSLNEDQRRKLPPWIREGLEKMERDKRKKE